MIKTGELTDRLCTKCGLCCDGSLFADVELSGKREAVAMELLGLEVEEGDGEARALLVQPCKALKGTRCGVYEHRPGCCRTFECKLLQETRSGVVSVQAALEIIVRALELKRANAKLQHPEKLQGSKADEWRRVRAAFLG